MLEEFFHFPLSLTSHITEVLNVWSCIIRLCLSGRFTYLNLLFFFSIFRLISSLPKTALRSRGTSVVYRGTPARDPRIWFRLITGLISTSPATIWSITKYFNVLTSLLNFPVDSSCLYTDTPDIITLSLTRFHPSYLYEFSSSVRAASLNTTYSWFSFFCFKVVNLIQHGGNFFSEFLHYAA